MDDNWAVKRGCREVNPVIFDGGNDWGRRIRGDWSAARSVCRPCPVQEECLEYVMGMPRAWNPDEAFAANRTPDELRAERAKRDKKARR